MSEIWMPRAEAFLDAVLTAFEEAGTPNVVRLTVYESQHDYEILRPEDQPALKSDHDAMIEFIAGELHMEGVPVEAVVLDASAYLRWLAAENLKNTPENRAAWTSLHNL